MEPLLLSHYTMTSCLGRGLEETAAALRAQRSGLRPCDFETATLNTWTGTVDGLAGFEARAAPDPFDCRNNQLAALGLSQDHLDGAVQAVIARFGRQRVGVFLGTSTSGILQTELSYRRRDPSTGALPADFHYATTHNPFSVAAYVQQRYQLEGPVATLSTACSSAAKVFGTARRMIACDLIDAALVGGVDSLCLTTLYGFNSLELLAEGPCRPFDLLRDGISIGEAAAFIIVERVPRNLDADAILLLGVGESSDAYHMSSPHPDGLGARLAMERALADAGLGAEAVHYINLHGTATPSNDAAEAKAVAAVFGTEVPCSSTKGATGHTLGAAGGIEAVITALALREGLMPGGVHTKTVDPALPVHYLRDNRQAAITCALTNSFGFGGSNCSLVLGRAR